MSKPSEESDKKLICRFHGGHLDGEFDSERDTSFAAKSRRTMIMRYRNALPGEYFDELSEAKLNDFMAGVSACHLFSDADGVYILLNRVETDTSITLDLAYAHVQPQLSQRVLQGTFRGKPFCLPLTSSEH